MPFIVAFAGIIASFFGAPAAYIARGMIGNLYAPLLFTFVLLLLYGAYSVLRLNLKLNGLSIYN